MTRQLGLSRGGKMARVDYDQMAASYDRGRALFPDGLEGWRAALTVWLPPTGGLPVLDLGHPLTHRQAGRTAHGGGLQPGLGNPDHGQVVGGVRTDELGVHRSPLWRVTVIWVAPSTTWALVRM